MGLSTQHCWGFSQNPQTSKSLGLWFRPPQSVRIFQPPPIKSWLEGHRPAPSCSPWALPACCAAPSAAVPTRAAVLPRAPAHCPARSRQRVTANRQARNKPTPLNNHTIPSLEPVGLPGTRVLALCLIGLRAQAAVWLWQACSQVVGLRNYWGSWLSGTMNFIELAVLKHNFLPSTSLYSDGIHCWYFRESYWAPLYLD